VGTQGPTESAGGAVAAEGPEQRVVHQRLGEPGHRGAGDEAVRAEGGHQLQGRLGDGQAAVVEYEVLTFVLVKHVSKLLVGSRKL